jgi:N-acetylglucosamine transport system substrate-binding protein
MPKGAALEFMLPPVLSYGKGEPTAVVIKTEPWMIPTKAKHPQEAIELFKYMTSLPKAKQFVEQKGTLMAIKGSDETKLMPELVNAAKAIRESKDTYAILYREWYPALNQEMENALTALLNGTETPESFCDRIEKKAEELRNDSSVVKRKVD